MSNFCQSLLSHLKAGKGHNGTQCVPLFPTNKNCDTTSCGNNSLGMLFMITFTLLICLFGFVGNGTVIWLLAFRIKRNHFSTYILNLSIADFGVLTAIVAIDINWVACMSHFGLLRSLFYTVFLFTYSASQFLLTAISIDRCVCVFFPIWYHFHKHKKQSAIVCAALWFLAFMPSGIHITLKLTEKFCNLSSYQFLANGLLCTLLMSLSTVTLSRKIYFRPKQCKQRKLLTAVFLTLLLFLLLAIPMDAVQFMALFHENPYLLEYAFICASLNSTVNPVIYFLVGRQKGHHFGTLIKSILENILKEGEDSKEELECATQNKSLSSSP